MRTDLNGRPAPGPVRFYLDESGSTGDVAKLGAGLSFGGQPIFVLAAVGSVDDGDLAAKLRELAKRHEVIGTELRSKNLVGKPELAGDLADHLAATDSPVFIEMMDKRFLLIINLLNCLLLPPVRGFDETSAMAMRKIWAELMADSLPDGVLVAFARACDTTLREDLMKVFPALRGWAGDPARGEFRPVLVDMVEDACADVADAREPDGHLRLLPLPDVSVTGRSISMLPGLSALTNIYARINKYRCGRLAGVALVHDEHMLFGQVLSGAKEAMERLSADEALPEVPDADYRLTERAELSFASSALPGIQAADILAGLVMRFFRDASTGRAIAPAVRRSMASVMELTHRPEARGINMVASGGLLARAGFSMEPF